MNKQGSATIYIYCINDVIEKRLKLQNSAVITSTKKI